MKPFSEEYCRLVAEYATSGDEALLIRIGALAGQAVVHGLPLEDVADLHHGALAALGLQGRAPLAAERVTTCLSEFLMIFGLAYRDRTQCALDLQRVDSHRQKFEALGQLSAGIAHEFNNLLQPITGLAELALEECRDDDIKEVLSTILGSARKAASIVRHLLTSVRQMTPGPQVIPFGRTIQEEVGFLRRAMPPSLLIETTIGDLDTPILGHAGELGQIVHNLVRNAADAMGGTGTVHIEVIAKPSDGTICLHVRDNGGGMDAATAARIFDPFFSTKGPGQGTGLGLTVVQGIVNDWNGVIKVESLCGKGTSISIVFPSVDR